MAKKAAQTGKNGAARGARSVGASALTQSDADQFRVIAENFGKANTSSKAAAQKTLQALGIHSKSGKLTSRYKTAKSR